MSFAFHDSNVATSYGATTTLNVTIAVTAGDLVVVFGSVILALTIDGVADEDVNSYTLLTQLTSDAASAKSRAAYCIATETNATLTITITTSAGTDRRNVEAMSFTPDPGDVVTLEDEASKGSGWEASPWETATFDTLGDDEVCVGFLQAAQATVTYTNQEISSGTAAVVPEADNSGATGFYRLLVSTHLSSAVAEADPSATNRYTAQVLAFKSEPGAGGTIVPLVMSHYRRLRS